MKNLSFLFKWSSLSGVFWLAIVALIFNGVALALPGQAGFIASGIALMALFAAIFLTFQVMRAVHRARETCENLAQGDMESRLVDIREKGDFGEMLHSINDMADHFDAFLREAMASMQYVSENRYFRRILEDGLHGSVLGGARVFNIATKNVENKMVAFENVSNNFEDSLKEVSNDIGSTIGELQDASGNMAQAISSTTEDLAKVVSSATGTSQNVQTISSAAEEMSSSIGEVNQQISQTSKVSNEASDKAEAAREKMQELVESARRIGEVISLIEDIAEQTNLLALNATIEAARAGDAGKGFAVVASEVKNLATQTGQATDEIGGQIVAIQATINDSAAAFTEISQIIDEIKTAATVVAGTIEEQSAAAREIASSAEKAANGANESANLVGAIGQAVNMVEEVSKVVMTVSEKLSDQSSKDIRLLVTKMNTFRDVLEKGLIDSNN